MFRTLCAVVCVAAGGIGPLLAQAPVAAPPTPPPAAPQVNWRNLSIDELIARLPLVINDVAWDPAASNGVKHAAVVELSRRLASAEAEAAAKLMTDAQWREALQRTGAIRVRTVWPKDLPYAISVDVPLWLGLGRITLIPATPGWQPNGVGDTTPQSCGTYAMAAARNARLGLVFGSVEGEPKELVFQVQVEQGIEREPYSSDVRTLWKGKLCVPFKRVASWEEALTPTADPKLAEGIRDALSAGVRAWGDSSAVPFLVLDPDCAKYPSLATVVLDFKVEVLKDGRVVEESGIVALDADVLNLFSSVQKDFSVPRFYGSASFEKVPASELSSDADRAHWSVKLTGRTKWAACAWSATQRWEGSITIPWSELVANEARRAGPEGRGPEASTPFLR